MKNVFFITLYTIYTLYTHALYANDCLQYKASPKIHISVPRWNKTVVQPLDPMDMRHGKVVATLTENFEIIGDVVAMEDGFCVGLKSVNTQIGYSDFQVMIDSRHKASSCAYNAILNHEDAHIRAYLSVIDDDKVKITNAINLAANSVMPIFVKQESDTASALDLLNEKLQSHPEIILMNQKIQAEQELRNNQVDTGIADYLKEC